MIDIRYNGGKSRISNNISEIINKYTKDKTFVSLFCGGCAIESKIVAERMIINDKHEHLIAMWKDAQNSRNFPSSLTREEYYEVKRNQDYDKGLAGFVGFGCSFGGKWWGGYASDKVNTNYCLQNKNGISKYMKTGLKNAEFTCLDYKDVKIQDGSIVYCDPPYESTTGYGRNMCVNHDEFWEYVRELSQNNLIFVSEINAPEGFVAIWEKPLRRQVSNVADIRFQSTERLFVHRSSVDKLT